MIRGNGYKLVKIYKYTAGMYVDGEWSKGTRTAIEDVMIPRIITPQQEKRLPEGAYKAGDIKFYKRGSIEYSSGDVIEYNGIKYRIGDISERHEGGFVIYFAKREYGNA